MIGVKKQRIFRCFFIFLNSVILKKNMKKILNSFKFAINGLKEVFLGERNFQIMAAIAFLVVGAMFYFPTERTEKAVLAMAIFLVLTLEIINSLVERLMDFLQPQHDELVRIIKDLSAAAVLTASIGAVIIGLIIFLPYIF